MARKKGKKSAKKQEAALSRRERAAILAQEINSQLGGRGEIVTGDQLTNMFILRRPTGILSLDLALGGGFPSGGLSQIIGRDGATKTYLSNLVIAHVQKVYGDEACIGLCMTEMPYDKDFAKYMCGVRIAYSDREIEMGEKALGRAYTDEEVAFLKDQVGTIHHVVGGTAETLLETAARMIESNIYQVILIDSFGALLTKAEAEAEDGIESKHYGGAAMVITQFMHRLHAALNMRDEYGNINTTTVIGINQYRDNVGGSLYANPMKISGGNALRHGKLVDLKLSAGSKIYTTEKNQKKVVGKEVNWELLKGKAGCHDGPKGKYIFNFEESGRPFGVDIAADAIMTGVRFGVVSQAGAWLTIEGICLPDGSQVKAQGLSNMVSLMEKHPEVLDYVKEEVYKLANVKFIVREENEG